MFTGARTGRSEPGTKTYNGAREQTTLSVTADALGAGAGLGAAASSATATNGTSSCVTAGISAA